MRKTLIPRVSIVLLLLILFIGGNLFGQIEFPEDKVKWKFTVEQNGDEATIIGTITMVEHWHIYAANLPEGAFSIASDIELTKSSKFKLLGKIIEPKPIFKHDELADEDLYYHSGTIVMKRKIKILSEEDFTISGEFIFQTCDDTHCLMPHKAEFKLKISGIKEDGIQEVENIEEPFLKVDGDEAKDENGVIYVKVNNKWHEVPEGNSIAFYKKYLMLQGDHE